MPTFVGFSTQNADAVREPQVKSGVDGGAGSINNPIRYSKKFRTINQELVVQDFINSLNITQGQLPGRPEIGTTIWAFIFEPNVQDVRIELENEIRRVAAYDPRLTLHSVSTYPQGNGILMEIQVEVQMFEDPIQLQLFFDQNSGKASLL